MSLIGSLQDLGVMELIRFTAGGRKTGELIIASPEHDARLYFSEGAIVRLEMNGRTGREVLEEVLGWTEGEFEFRRTTGAETGIDAGASSMDHEPILVEDIDQAPLPADLRSTVLQDAAECRDAAGAERAAGRDAALEAVLEGFLRRHDFLLHLGVMHASGDLLAAATAGPQRPDGVDLLSRSLASFIRKYPRGRLRRIILEDEPGSLSLCCLGDGRVVLAVADRSARVGVVSVCLERLVRQIGELSRA